MPLLLIQSASGAQSASGPDRHGGHAAPPSGGSAASTSNWQLAADRIHSGSTPPESSAGVTQSAMLAAARRVAQAPTTTTSTSTSTTTSTTRPVPAVRMVRAPSTTEATSPPSTQAAVSAVADVGGQAGRLGIVTYYDDPGGPGTCASPTLPFGTVVRVTNPANGLSVECRVNDREADTARQIDLDTASFALLAPLSQGVIYDAPLSW